MKKFAYAASAFLLPLIAGAQGKDVNDIQDVGELIIELINGVAVPVVFALAFIVFIWGVFQYFVQGGQDEEKRDAGKNLMLYGLIGFFIMVSVWGLVNILVGTVDLNDKALDYPSAKENN